MTHARYLRLETALRLRQPQDKAPFYTPSSEVFADTPWENVMEVVNAWKEWGRYP